MLWEDGKGSGRKAGVDVRNFGQVSAVSIPDETYVALHDNLAFHVDTGILTIPASFSGPVISLKNLSGTSDIVCVAFVIIDLPSTGSQLSLFRKPEEGALGANAPKVSVNRNFEAGNPADVEVNIWDNATGTAGITGFTPVTDGTIGPLPLSDKKFRTDVLVLGQANLVTMNITSGAAGFEAAAGFDFYFDTTGAK